MLQKVWTFLGGGRPGFKPYSHDGMYACACVCVPLSFDAKLEAVVPLLFFISFLLVFFQDSVQLSFENSTFNARMK